MEPHSHWTNYLYLNGDFLSTVQSACFFQEVSLPILHIGKNFGKKLACPKWKQYIPALIAIWDSLVIVLAKGIRQTR